MEVHDTSERIRASSVLFNAVSRYGDIKFHKNVTRETLVKLITKPIYRPMRKKIRGKTRLLHVPSKELKILLKNILNVILYDFAISKVAHGGVLKRSIVTNAEAHIDSRSFFEIDFRNYFPSITIKMVIDCLVNLFEKRLQFGFLENCGLISFREARGLAKIIGRLATCNGILPQGAPTSPYLQNLILYDLDEKLCEFSQRHGLVYTRFIDDMIFSSRESYILRETRCGIMQFIKAEVGHFLKFNRTKIHYRRGKKRVPIITGVTIVESKNGVLSLSLPQEQIDRYRNVINLASYGLASEEQVWGVMGLVKMIFKKVPQELRNPFMKFLENCYPDSWDRKLDLWRDWL